MRAVICAALLGLVACKPPTFEAPIQVDSVRILANQADTPYAAPGATVNMTSLAIDARPNPSEPMHVYWLPGACLNPPNDAYYACFQGFDGGLPRGVELGSHLVAGDRFSFPIPADVIDDSRPVGPGEAPYGLAVFFTLACAGRLFYAPPAASGAPDAVPFACSDAAGTQLGAKDFVFAYSLVYAFADRQNENPVLDSVSYGGMPIDPEHGLDLDHCTKSKIDDCSTKKLDVSVPEASQELDPTNLDSNGRPLKESLYVQYFSTGGKITNDTTVIFDPHEGRLGNTGDDFRSPQQAGEYRLWAVVHDNRSGVTWQELALHVH